MDTHCRVNALIKIAAGTTALTAAKEALPGFAKGVVDGVAAPIMGTIAPARIASKALPSFAKGFVSGVSAPARTAARVGSGLARRSAESAPMLGGEKNVVTPAKSQFSSAEREAIRKAIIDKFTKGSIGHK